MGHGRQPRLDQRGSLTSRTFVHHQLLRACCLRVAWLEKDGCPLCEAMEICQFDGNPSRVAGPTCAAKSLVGVNLCHETSREPEAMSPPHDPGATASGHGYSSTVHAAGLSCPALQWVWCIRVFPGFLGPVLRPTQLREMVNPHG